MSESIGALNFVAPYLGAIDQGTSSSRFIIFDKTGQVVVSAQKEFDQICLESGWVEHDPTVIFESVQACIVEAMIAFKNLGLSLEDLKGVGITNQRETLVCWDSVSHKPLHNAIVWCDARTQALVEKYREQYEAKDLQKKCGLPISTYFSALKAKWFFENVPAVNEAKAKGTLRFGTIDSWIIYQFSVLGDRESVYVTDVTNASRTCLMNLKTLEWDDELLEFFDVGRENLPKIVSSSEVYTHFDKSSPLAGVAIAGCLGDQQAAFVGQQCFTPGSAKNTYGTGCFMLFNTGEEPIFSTHGLLTTVGYKFGDDKPIYALEGSVAVAGSAVKWLRDNIGIIQTAPQIGELASHVKDTGDVYFVTAFSGLFAPHWHSAARGCLLGLTQYTTKHHIARAALEATCFQTRSILDCMNADSKQPLKSLKVDGGMTNSDLCMQVQSDLLGIEVTRPAMRETSALGAAMVAGYALGVYTSLDDLNKVNKFDVNTFTPEVDQANRDARYERWNEAIKRSMNWAL